MGKSTRATNGDSDLLDDLRAIEECQPLSSYEIKARIHKFVNDLADRGLLVSFYCDMRSKQNFIEYRRKILAERYGYRIEGNVIRTSPEAFSG